MRHIRMPVFPISLTHNFHKNEASLKWFSCSDLSPCQSATAETAHIRVSRIKLINPPQRNKEKGIKLDRNGEI